MTTTTHALSGPSLSAMARIEAVRFARNPVFLVGTAFALGLIAVLTTITPDPASTDLLSWPVTAAFFIGLPSILVAARLTRSTETAAEALDTAPGTESRRTLAVALACLVPFAAGVVWLVELLVIVSIHEPTAQDWWFGTMPDWQVWAILVVLAPVAGLGGGLLGVVTGRWLHFPGAPVLVLLATLLACVFGSIPSDGSFAQARLWLPWTVWQSGTFGDGTAYLYAGNPAFYLVYVLCLCAAAVLVAVWHDRTARTARLRRLIAATVVIGLAALALSITTGNEENLQSDPVPWKVQD